MGGGRRCRPDPVLARDRVPGGRPPGGRSSGSPSWRDKGEAARLEFSSTVGEALSVLPAGGRHALAVTLFEAELTERLDGAVAEA